MPTAGIAVPSSWAHAARFPSRVARARRLLRRAALGLLLAGMALPARSATYSYTSPLFSAINDNTTCAVGTCATYTTAMRVTGSFTTPAPLPPNLTSANITSAVSSYSFDDGVNTIGSSDPDARIRFFNVTTDGSGAITDALIVVHQWTTGSNPHDDLADRLNEIVIGPDSIGRNNGFCGPGGIVVSADVCSSFFSDTNSSFGGTPDDGTWTSPAPQPPTTYLYSSPFYTFVNTNSTCTVGTCASYTTAMRITGSFTTAGPLAANLGLANIAALLTSYSFNDGVNTIANGDPDARIVTFQVTTDGSAGITAESIRLQQWETGSSPHAAGDRFDSIALETTVAEGVNNFSCVVVGTAPSSGVADICSSPSSDTNTSAGGILGAGTWTVLGGGGPIAAVPTLSTWAMGLLALLLAGLAAAKVGRR
jgi:hypothetical protein